MEPSLYLSEEGNKRRSKSPFIESKIKDVHKFASYKDASEMNQEEVIEILKENGYLLKFIKNPTLNMVIAANEKRSGPIYYVKNLTEEMLDTLLVCDENKEFLHQTFPFYACFINNLSREYLNKIVTKSFFYKDFNITEVDKEVLKASIKNTPDRFNHIIEQKDKLDAVFFQELVDLVIDTVLLLGVKPEEILFYFNSKEDQCEELCLSALKYSWKNYNYVKVKSKKVYLECLKYNTKYAKDLLKLYNVKPEDVLSINGSALKYIVSPTDEQIKIALRQDGKAIEFVKNHTEEYCLIAVNQNGLTVRYMENPSLDVCYQAVKNNKNALVLIKNEDTRIKLRKLLKEESFNFANVDLTKGEIEEKLNVISNVVSVVKDMLNHNLTNFNHIDIINRCLKKLHNKTLLDKDTLVRIIKNQIIFITGITKVIEPKTDIVKKELSLLETIEEFLLTKNNRYPVDIFSHKTFIVMVLNKIPYKIIGEEYCKLCVGISKNVRMLRNTSDGLVLEYGQEDIIIKTIENYIK